MFVELKYIPQENAPCLFAALKEVCIQHINQRKAFYLTFGVLYTVDCGTLRAGVGDDCN